VNQSSPYPPIISVGKGSTTIVSSHAMFQNRSGVESATTLSNKRRRTTQSRAMTAKLSRML
jgi:hypothetical protein